MERAFVAMLDAAFAYEESDANYATNGTWKSIPGFGTKAVFKSTRTGSTVVYYTADLNKEPHYDF